MADYEKELLAFFDAHSVLFAPEKLEMIRSLIDNYEYEIALGIATDHLLERRVSLSMEFYRQLERLDTFEEEAWGLLLIRLQVAPYWLNLEQIRWEIAEWLVGLKVYDLISADAAAEAELLLEEGSKYYTPPYTELRPGYGQYYQQAYEIVLSHARGGIRKLFPRRLQDRVEAAGFVFFGVSASDWTSDD